MTDDFLIAFGPANTYIARAPKISRSNLNQTVSTELVTKLDESKQINFAVFPSVLVETRQGNPDEDHSSDPDPYVSYSKKGHVGDSKTSIPQENYLPDLKDWLKDRWGTGGLQVVGNGMGGWWALSSRGATKSTANLPRDVRQLLKPYNPHGKVVHLAFGTDGAYVVLFEDGHADWDLKGQYPELDAELDIRGQGELIYVSLSAYHANHFFAAFKDATVFYEFPEGAEDLDDDFVSAEALRVVVHSATAKSTSPPPPKKPSALKEFSKDVLKDVTEVEIENVIVS